jgi:hypothetical protein
MEEVIDQVMRTYGMMFNLTAEEEQSARQRLTDYRSNCADLRFAGTTVPGHFAQTGPVFGRLVLARPVPVRFARAGPFFGDFRRAVSLPAHYRRA